MSEVDEALESTRQVTKGFKTAPEYPWEMARVLGAEVERLRAENERLNKENDDWHEASRKLREELDATTEALSHERDCSTGLADELGRSEKEAATARLALDVALKECAELRKAVNQQMDDFELVTGRLEAKLKWFEERDERIERSHSWSVDGRALYEKHNPKPGAAT